jgi:hypothetical protein
MKRYRIAVLVAAVALLGAMAMPGAQATGTDGCTPGFWKTHPEAWPADYTPGQNMSGVLQIDFTTAGLPSNVSFQTALSFTGGSGVTGGAKILLRATAAAFLNAAVDDSLLWYPLHRDDMRVMVQDAWGDRADMIALASYFDGLNNLGSGYC